MGAPTSLHRHLGYPGPSAAVLAVPAAPLPWCLGSAWDAGLWPVGLPGPWEKLLTTTPPRCLCLPGRAGEVSWPHLPWQLLETSATWDRVQGLQRPHLLCGVEPPATACHVAQHVTAQPCCLELSQAEAELAPGGAGLGLSLQPLPGIRPREGQPLVWGHTAKQYPPEEVLVRERGVAGS